MTASPEFVRQLREMLAKSGRALRSAQRDFEAGDYDFASSRAYFTAFYALEALLLTEGITCSTHSGAISSFSQHFVATGTVPRDFGRRIARLFRQRQIGDYEFGISIDGDGARDDLEHARVILDAAEEFLKRQGFLREE